MSIETLSWLFGFSYRTLMLNLDEISVEDSLVRPGDSGNSINWIVGHITASRDIILKLVGQSAEFNKKETFPYRRGATEEDYQSLIPLDRILQSLDSSQKKLTDTLEKISMEQLEEKAAFFDDSDEMTLFNRLSFLHFHEAYHVGQVGLLRRNLGREGMIK